MGKERIKEENQKRKKKRKVDKEGKRGIRYRETRSKERDIGKSLKGKLEKDEGLRKRGKRRKWGQRRNGMNKENYL